MLTPRSLAFISQCAIVLHVSMIPVLESLPLAVVSGGQVQIRWAGLAWHWPNAKPNLTIGTKCLVNIARNAKQSLAIQSLPIMILPVMANHKNLPIRNLPIRNIPIWNLPVSRELKKLMPVCSSLVPFMQQYHKIVPKNLDLS